MLSIYDIAPKSSAVEVVARGVRGRDGNAALLAADPWDNARIYVTGDVVDYLNVYYVSLRVNSGLAPATNPTDWHPLPFISRGEKGVPNGIPYLDANGTIPAEFVQSLGFRRVGLEFDSYHNVAADDPEMFLGRIAEAAALGTGGPVGWRAIVVEDGYYDFDLTVDQHPIMTQNLAIFAASGNRDAVILRKSVDEGTNVGTMEVGGKNTLLAHMTVLHEGTSTDYAIHADTLGTVGAEHVYVNMLLSSDHKAGIGIGTRNGENHFFYGCAFHHTDNEADEGSGWLAHNTHAATIPSIIVLQDCESFGEMPNNSPGWQYTEYISTRIDQLWIVNSPGHGGSGGAVNGSPDIQINVGEVQEGFAPTNEYYLDPTSYASITLGDPSIADRIYSTAGLTPPVPNRRPRYGGYEPSPGFGVDNLKGIRKGRTSDILESSGLTGETFNRYAMTVAGERYVGTGATALVLAGYTRPNGSVAWGQNAGLVDTSATLTALGYNAGRNNTGGSNTFVGRSAGTANTTGANNAFGGTGSGQANTTASGNTFWGKDSGKANTTGAGNTYIGQEAGLNATTATRGTGVGDAALKGLTIAAADNVGFGRQSGYAPGGTAANATTTGNRQTLLGTQTGQASATQRNDITTGGYRSLADGDYGTAYGSGTLAGAAGAGAFGADSAGAGASTTLADAIALGTARHTLLVGGGAGLGSGRGAISIHDAQLAPTTNPVAGGLLYSEGGVLKWRDPNAVAAVISTPAPNAQTFLSSGTWTKPAGNYTWALIDVIAGSSGGGSGKRGQAGTIRCGGGGAGGAGWTTLRVPFAALGATETVTVGAAGLGGAAQTVNDTNGINGTSGGASSFGQHARAINSNAGNGGTAAAGTGGGGGQGISAGSAGGAASTTGLVGAGGGTSAAGIGGPTGGGAGGGISAADVPAAGGNGGTSLTLAGAAGSGNRLGGTGGAINTDGSVAAVVNAIGTSLPGTGGGGGGASIVGPAGAGAAGSRYGAGGGGGGASLNGNSSGPGGNGSDGIITIICV